MKSSLEEGFLKLLIDLQLDEKFTREYTFHPTRNWRFDFADVENKVAVELQGETWGKIVYIRGRPFVPVGAHNTGAMIQKDTHKANSATLLGWRVLFYSSVKDATEHFITDYATLLTGEWHGNYNKQNKLSGETNIFPEMES